MDMFQILSIYVASFLVVLLVILVIKANATIRLAIFMLVGAFVGCLLAPGITHSSLESAQMLLMNTMTGTACGFGIEVLVRLVLFFRLRLRKSHD